ncbi:MAG: LacI family DNA-binding transcriptional regulator [Bacteroidales bacterium]|nr:LacI family DNA-binding transcriptional regulator [Bacteroidales bacterium]
MEKSHEKTRIKDIALLAGVSEGTVDRVLHNRGNVSPKSRKKVEEALAQIDYKPNLYASALAQKRKINLICIIPIYNPGDYWEGVAEGIERAHEEMSMLNVYIRIIHFDQYDLYSCSKAFESVLNLNPDGIIFPPFFKEESINFIAKLNLKKIPFVFLDSHIPNVNMLAYYGQDSFRSGEIAAKLLTSMLNSDATIAMFHTYRKGDLGSNQTMEREKGFLNYMTQFHSDFKTHTIGLIASDNERNIEELNQYLEKHPETTGAVIFNSLTYLITDYLKQLNRSDIKVVGYDILERNKESLRNDDAQFLLAQRPEEQGYLSVKALCENLLFNRIPIKINYMPIDIIIKENVEFT